MIKELYAAEVAKGKLVKERKEHCKRVIAKLKAKDDLSDYEKEHDFIIFADHPEFGAGLHLQVLEASVRLRSAKRAFNKMGKILNAN